MMRKACILIFTLFLISACTTPATSIPQSEVELSVTNIPTQAPTSTFTPEPTNTIASTYTPTTFCDCTATPTHTPKATWQPTSNVPGILLHGTVTLPNGNALVGVEIHYALSDSKNLLAITDIIGSYENFVYVPADENLKVWAELTGYVFKPAQGSKSWINGEFEWVHLAGYEKVELSFIGTPQ